MVENQRRHDRHTLRTEEIEGRFKLNVAGEWHPLMRINDVSVSGMGLYFAAPLEAGTPVKVSYEADDMHVMVSATVVWHSPDDTAEDGVPSYRLGLQFNPLDADTNVLMFMALRKYLDAFE
ncbi:MAG TPA: PilZ domain-containing protein [Gammaproteobacteria bacterium]|nr:PilZ domain-containing protein [Gammaproteobacteria bacterium]